MEEMIVRYLELYKEMETSGKPEKMMVFGEAEKMAFARMVELSPEFAQSWLDKLEAVHWCNYLSQHEAAKIVEGLVNADGTRGAHWDYPVFKGAVESLGRHMMEEPYYNCYALWVTANMFYSDHYNSAKEYVPEEDMPKFFYTMAVEKLKDADRPRFVREYFADASA